MKGGRGLAGKGRNGRKMGTGARELGIEERAKGRVKLVNHG